MKLLLALSLVLSLASCMSLQMVNGNTIDIQLTVPVSLLP